MAKSQKLSKDSGLICVELIEAAKGDSKLKETVAEKTAPLVCGAVALGGSKFY